MKRRPPSSTRTDTLVPYTSLFRSAFDDLRRLTAGGVVHAEVDALGAHRLHGSVAEEGLRRRQPDELDALLLRVGDVALRAGTVLAVAAAAATHHHFALTHRRAHAIHGGIHAAQYPTRAPTSLVVGKRLPLRLSLRGYP